MPEAAKNYSITELEMCGLLKKVDFNAIVDHLVITHIMRSKAEPATTRIKRLLELFSPYSLNLYYIKGKDMVLRDISQECQIFSTDKVTSKLPEIHGVNKGLDPYVQLGKQRSFPSLPIQTFDKGLPTHPIPKPGIGQGRSGLRRKVKTPQPISLLHQLPAQPITKHVQKTVMPLPEPTNQSESCATSNYAQTIISTSTGRSHTHYTANRP